MLRKYYGIPNNAEYGDGFMSRFPILFQHRNKSIDDTCMYWRIECPAGWYHILEQLCTVLEFYNIEFKDKYGIAIIAYQIKEKFGTLRFYYTIMNVDKDGIIISRLNDEGCVTIDENIHRISTSYLEMLADKYIKEAESLTFNTCAQCGIPLDNNNKVKTHGLITYICKECDNKNWNSNNTTSEPKK